MIEQQLCSTPSSSTPSTFLSIHLPAHLLCFFYALNIEAKLSKSSIFVIGHPLSVSNFLVGRLEKHPRLDILGKCPPHPVFGHINYLSHKPDHSFKKAYALGPKQLERRDDRDGDARKEASSDETYQKAFDRLQKSMIRAEKEVQCHHSLCSATVTEITGLLLGQKTSLRRGRLRAVSSRRHIRQSRTRSPSANSSDTSHHD